MGRWSRGKIFPSQSSEQFGSDVHTEGVLKNRDFKALRPAKR
jgi:hypothetical protein